MTTATTTATVIASFTLLTLTGCADLVSPPAPPPASLSSGAYGVTIDPGAEGGGHLTLLRGGEVLVTLPASSFVLGTRESVTDDENYDPHPLVVPSVLYPVPADLAWDQGARLDITDRSGAMIRARVTTAAGARAGLTVEVSGEGRFQLRFTPDAEQPRAVAYLRVAPRIDAAEGLYGLGEHFDDVNQRGHVRAMQIEVDGAIESSYNEVHYPIPLLIGTRGWGLFVESPYPGVFEVATTSDDRVDATFGTGTASFEGLTFHLYAADHPLDVTRRYYDTTGDPAVPARWAFGPWVWRNENKDQAEVLSDLQAMRDLDLATTAYWIDRPYATGVNTFDYDPAKFPDAQAMIDQMHGLGFRTALWHAPYLDEADPSTAALRAEAEENGYYPTQHGVLLNKWGKPVDLTRPEAFAWWQDLIRRYDHMGVEGYKLDYGEDVIVGPTPGRNVWRFADGSDERTMHQRFQLSYHRAYAETLPEDGGFLICRHGTYGDQVNVSVVWPGDLDASFAKHREMVTEGDDTYNAVGGLPASVVAALSLGPSGYPFFASDTGGYRHGPPDKELFTRWFQQTAFSAVMQVGNANSTVAWEPDAATGYDAEMLGWYRRYTRLHLRLMPYLWTLAKRLSDDGRPIMRPLGLAYPELGAHPNDAYMLGDDLLVAPVVERGATSREVLFPPGRWLDFWTGEVIEGGAAQTVDAPLDVIPVYLREGGIVPLLRPTIDTIAPVGSPDLIDSYATTPGRLHAMVAPSAALATFTLFDGSLVSVKREGGVITLATSDGSELRYGVTLEIIGFGAAPPLSVIDGAKPLMELPDEASLDGVEAGFALAQDTGGRLVIKLASGQHHVTVE